MASEADLRRSVRVAAEPAAALAAVGRAAEEWGAAWEAGIAGGRLELPVSAGLRHGRLTGRVEVSSALGADRGPGAEVAFHPERSEWHLWLPAVAVLAVAAAGALLTVVWPFFPELLPVAPFGAIAALGGWFLVVTRLQNRGAEEFLELVRHQAAAAGAEPETGGIPGSRARL